MLYFLIFLFALLFGLIEGVTEWLPISSTGHMALFEEVLSLFGYDITKELSFSHGRAFFELFLVVIQLGAILAVLVYFFPKLWPWWRRKIDPESELAHDPIKREAVYEEDEKRVWIRWGKTLLGILPALVFGLLFELAGWESALTHWGVIAAMLILYGVLFVLLEIYLSKKGKEPKYASIDDLPWKTAFYIGCFQVLALIPGTSRSGVTILGALLLLSSREAAAEFSFYLSIPVMLGASLLKIVSFLMKSGLPDLNESLFLLIGTLSSFLVSLFAVRWLMRFLKKHSFKPFGYYRIALGCLILLVFGLALALR